MGPIENLRDGTSTRKRILRSGRTPLSKAFVVYTAAGLTAISFGLGNGQCPTLRAAHRVTTAAAAASPVTTRPLSGRDARRTAATVPRLSRLADIFRAARDLGASRSARSSSDGPPPVPQPEEPPTAPLPANPPPAQPLAISGVDVSVSPFDARVSWATNFAATGQEAYEIGGTPAIWAPPAQADLAHETDFVNLRPSTDYTLWLRATDEWGRAATIDVQVRTSSDTGQTDDYTSASEGAILVNGRRVFPLALWDVCPSDVSRRINDGINLFMGDGCGDEPALLTRLHGRAFAVTDAANGLRDVPGLIGWYYPDELDGRLASRPSNEDIDQLAVDPPGGLLSFLTLTNHFYSGADPLPIGRDLYPQLASLANVLGFDLYPLQNWCRTDRFDAVYKAQVELEALGGGKPTYQWIEARQMDCQAGSLDPTPASVKAETWLAIAGGADGIGYFPNNWRDDVGFQIRDLNSTITELAPALLSPKQDVQSNQDVVKAGARVLNGAVYVIAVNSGRAPVQASIHVSGLGGRTLDVLGEERQLKASDDDLITDGFDPLTVHIYVAAPLGWNVESTTPRTVRR
jgi:hypothetical protein